MFFKLFISQNFAENFLQLPYWSKNLLSKSAAPLIYIIFFLILLWSQFPVEICTFFIFIKREHYFHAYFNAKFNDHLLTNTDILSSLSVKLLIWQIVLILDALLYSNSVEFTGISLNVNLKWIIANLS